MLQYAPAAYNFVQKLRDLAIDLPSLNVTRYADEVPDYGPLSVSRTYNIQNKPFQETLGFTTKPFRNSFFKLWDSSGSNNQPRKFECLISIFLIFKISNMLLFVDD